MEKELCLTLDFRWRPASSSLRRGRIYSKNALVAPPDYLPCVVIIQSKNASTFRIIFVDPLPSLLFYFSAPHAAAYKPNAAFFEALGPNLGAACLRKVIKSIPDDIPVLLDVKRGDIGSTAEAYAEACYEREEGLSADGVTLSPLMGWDSVRPFVTGECAFKRETRTGACIFG